jgi:hypothetical protein
LYEIVFRQFPHGDVGWGMLRDLDPPALANITNLHAERTTLSVSLSGVDLLHSRRNIALNCCEWDELAAHIQNILKVDSKEWLNEDLVNAYFALINIMLLFDRENQEGTLGFFCAQSWWSFHDQFPDQVPKKLNGKIFGDFTDLLSLVDLSTTQIVLPTHINWEPKHWIVIVYNPCSNEAVVWDSSVDVLHHK